MKKFSLKKAICLVLALTCVLCLAACGGGNGNGDVAGTYKFKTLEMQGMSLDMDALIKQSGMDANSVKMELVLDKDGGFELNVDALGEGMHEKGTYKLSGEKLTMTVDGSDLKASLKDGVITIEEDGIKMTFAK